MPLESLGTVATRGPGARPGDPRRPPGARSSPLPEMAPPGAPIGLGRKESHPLRGAGFCCFKVPCSCITTAGRQTTGLPRLLGSTSHPPSYSNQNPGVGRRGVCVCVCVSVCVCTHTCGPLVSWARVRRARQTGPREGVSETFGLSLWVLYPDAVSPRFFFKAPVASRDVSQGGRSRDCGRPGTGCHVFLFPGSWQLPRACL